LNRETPLMKAIRAALAALPGVTVWRNSVGFDPNARVRYGLGVGSADLVGFVQVDGRAVFLGVECKTDTGRLSKEQRIWLDLVKRHGGIAGVARTPEEAVALIEEARSGAR
jgi:hypothetical protein